MDLGVSVELVPVIGITDRLKVSVDTDPVKKFDDVVRDFLY